MLVLFGIPIWWGLDECNRPTMDAVTWWGGLWLMVCFGLTYLIDLCGWRSDNFFKCYYVFGEPGYPVAYFAKYNLGIKKYES